MFFNEYEISIFKLNKININVNSIRSAKIRLYEESSVIYIELTLPRQGPHTIRHIRNPPQELTHNTLGITVNIINRKIYIRYILI